MVLFDLKIKRTPTLRVIQHVMKIIHWAKTETTAVQTRSPYHLNTKPPVSKQRKEFQARTITDKTSLRSASSLGRQRNTAHICVRVKVYLKV